MKANHGYFHRVLLAVASGVAVTLLPPLNATQPNVQEDFAGAFIVEHVSTPVDPTTTAVDVVGTGCVTGAGKASCENRNTQRVDTNGAGTATYWLHMPGGSVALKLTFEYGGPGEVNGIRFGGTFVVVADSGTGCYKHVTGTGKWMGGAEFTGVTPQGKPTGPGRWTFWGTLTRVK